MAVIAGMAGVAAFETEPAAAAAGDKLTISNRIATTTDALTPQTAVTSYCNFYEFGSVKSDAQQHAVAFKPKPWPVTIDGLCGKPGTYTLEDVLKPHALEERVYRMRCVEGWSMVIPWDGFSLGDFLKRFQPASTATFVEFTTVWRPQEMVGQRRRLSALRGRIEKACEWTKRCTHVPWKYGFKSSKAIVKIRFVDRQPLNTWQEANAEYYGFFANVNPDVPTPSA